MKYSTESKNQRCIKRYWFSCFNKYIGKNLNSKYEQKLLDQSKTYATDTTKTASKKSNSKISRGNW